MRLIYQKLTDYLVNILPEAYRGNFYSWMDDGKIVDDGRKITEQGEILFYLTYKAELLLHEFPFRQISPMWLMAKIKLAIDELDLEQYRLDRHEIDFDLNIIDEKTADLGFTIEFTEPVYITETDEQGEIDINGKQYNFEQPTEQFAEQINLYISGQSAVETITVADKE